MEIINNKNWFTKGHYKISIQSLNNDNKSFYYVVFYNQYGKEEYNSLSNDNDKFDSLEEAKLFIKHFIKE